MIIRNNTSASHLKTAQLSHTLTTVNSSTIRIFNRVFPKVDHSANIARIVLVENTIGSVVELNFCKRFGKDLRSKVKNDMSDQYNDSLGVCNVKIRKCLWGWKWDTFSVIGL